MPSSNAFNLRRDSWRCGQYSVLGAAASRPMCVFIHKIDTWDLKGDPSKVADCFYLFLPRMRPALLGAPGGSIPVTALLGHHAAVASGDGSLRSV